MEKGHLGRAVISHAAMEWFEAVGETFGLRWQNPEWGGDTALVSSGAARHPLTPPNPGPAGRKSGIDTSLCRQRSK